MKVFAFFFPGKILSLGFVLTEENRKRGDVEHGRKKGLPEKRAPEKRASEKRAKKPLKTTTCLNGLK